MRRAHGTGIAHSAPSSAVVILLLLADVRSVRVMTIAAKTCFADSAEWHTEAQEVRKLKVLPTTVDALDVFNTDTVKKMFEKHKIYKPAEVDAIANIMYERFWSEVQIELDTMVNMINQGLLPACAKDLAVYKDTGLAGKRQDVYSALPQAVDDLQALQLLWPEDAKKAARHAADVVKPAMLAARRVCEQCEELIATEHYPYAPCPPPRWRVC